MKNKCGADNVGTKGRVFYEKIISIYIMNVKFVTIIIIALLIGVGIGYVAAPNSPAVVEVPTATTTVTMTDTSKQKITATPGTTEWKIQSAMSAAPSDIAEAATIADWPGEDGKLPELRKGGNGWTCLPDYPASPGNDPICADVPAMEWFQSYMQKKTPDIKQAGIAYMLQGGSDPSNTDPFAEAPAPGEDWMSAPPHIMVFPTEKLDAKVYGTAMNGGPWIMWAGTPYEHLMIPVR